MNHKKSEWSKYVDDKALLRVNGKIKFKMHGYDGIVSRDSDTHCLFVKIYLKDTKKLSDEYYIEFNSASILDFIPMYDALWLNSNKTYKDLKFIKKETQKIINFLIEREIR